MDPRKLDRRITIQRPVANQNAFGEPIITWTDVDAIWAEKRDMRGMERFAAQQVMAGAEAKDIPGFRHMLFSRRFC